jgi:hypothetical protein
VEGRHNMPFNDNFLITTEVQHHETETVKFYQTAMAEMLKKLVDPMQTIIWN